MNSKVYSHAHTHTHTYIYIHTYCSEDICRDETRRWYYMCPVCDTRCDFWYLVDTCGFAHVSQCYNSPPEGVTYDFSIIPRCHEEYIRYLLFTPHV